MSYATFIVGLLAAAFGAYAMNFGWGIVAVERGWASLIAGAALLAGGLVVMALALVMAQVARLRAALIETRAPAGAAQEEAERLDAPQDAAPVLEAAESAAPPQPAAGAFEEAPKVSAREAPREPPKSGGEEASRPAAGPGAPERRAVVWADRPERRDEAQNSAAAAPSRRVEAPAPPVDNTPEASIDDVRRVVAQTIRERTAAPPPPEAARAAPPQPGEPLPRAQEPRAQGSRTEAAGAASAGPPAADLNAQEMSGAQNAAAQDKTDASAGQDERRKMLDREAPRRRPPSSSFHLPRAVGLDGLGPRSGPGESAAPAPARKPPAQDAAVIGRYESEGTSYVMFADGSIEATSPRGVFRFSSMTELKAFMEQQAPG